MKKESYAKILARSCLVASLIFTSCNIKESNSFSMRRIKILNQLKGIIFSLSFYNYKPNKKKIKSDYDKFLEDNNVSDNIYVYSDYLKSLNANEEIQFDYEDYLNVNKVDHNLYFFNDYLKTNKTPLFVNDSPFRIVYDHFAYKPFAKDVYIPFKISTPYGIKSFYGCHEDKVKDRKNFRELKSTMLKDMGLSKNSKVLEIVGDSNQFSKKGSEFLKEKLKKIVEENDAIIYGYTGYRGDDENKILDVYDINSALNAIVDEQPKLADKVIGNIVGHSIEVIEKYKCKGSKYIKYFITVYNSYRVKTSEIKKTSRFGSDIKISDFFADKLFMADGGMQSFAQAVNCLNNNIHIKAIYGLRTKENQQGFSAAKFLTLVKKSLIKNPNLQPKDVTKILEDYSKELGFLWRTDRADSNTKKPLFINACKEFIDNQAYKKLTKFFESEELKF